MCIPMMTRTAQKKVKILNESFNSFVDNDAREVTALQKYETMSLKAYVFKCPHLQFVNLCGFTFLFHLIFFYNRPSKRK